MNLHPGPACLIAALLCAVAARAEIVDIVWSDAGRFERRILVAPGKFAEVCGKLVKDQAVAWRFDADGALDFNIHYHLGKDVRYPERRDALARGSGQLRVAMDQDHCWMWTNRSERTVQLTLLLSR